MSRAGRKAKLGGPLARVGARGLRTAKATVRDYAHPPAHFDDVARDCYWVIVTDLAEAGELSRDDAPLIQMAARAYARWLDLDRRIAEGEAALKADQAPNAKLLTETSDKGFLSGAAQARAAAAKEYRACVGELGLSPVSRIKTHGALQASFLTELDAAAPKGKGGADNVLSMAGYQGGAA